ncbi:hypothetical protein [Faecalicoccus pleomorphus]|uniref:hypothetical protein n=1 Tax=Faecalicoccus pleomorphus TaxID=1323 RepID=UPI0022E0E289|nr:hypothetical protein [Faecalicoccus pleomorphus]
MKTLFNGNDYLEGNIEDLYKRVKQHRLLSTYQDTIDEWHSAGKVDLDQVTDLYYLKEVLLYTVSDHIASPELQDVLTNIEEKCSSGNWFAFKHLDNGEGRLRNDGKPYISSLPPKNVCFTIKEFCDDVIYETDDGALIINGYEVRQLSDHGQAIAEAKALTQENDPFDPEYTFIGDQTASDLWDDPAMCPPFKYTERLSNNNIPQQHFNDAPTMKKGEQGTPSLSAIAQESRKAANHLGTTAEINNVLTKNEKPRDQEI